MPARVPPDGADGGSEDQQQDQDEQADSPGPVLRPCMVHVIEELSGLFVRRGELVVVGIRQQRVGDPANASSEPYRPVLGCGGIGTGCVESSTSGGEADSARPPSSTTSTSTIVMLSRPPWSLAKPDKLGASLIRVGQPAQDTGDATVIHLVEQPIAAEQEPIAPVRDDRVHVDVHVDIDAERTSDDVALRMHGRRVLAQLAVSDEVLHEAVVLAELDECPVPEQVDARVADVGPGHELAVRRVDETEARTGSCPCRAAPRSLPARSKIARLAQLHAVTERARRRRRWPRACRICTASAEATSPPWWPPMPSATANRSVADQAGVLVVGADPAGVGGRAHPERRHSQLHDGVADLELVAPLHHHRALHLLAG